MCNWSLSCPSGLSSILQSARSKNATLTLLLTAQHLVWLPTALRFSTAWTLLAFMVLSFGYLTPGVPIKPESVKVPLHRLFTLLGMPSPLPCIHTGTT